MGHKKLLSLLVFLSLLIGLLFYLPPQTHASNVPAQQTAIDLDQGWQYQWGDSPIDQEDAWISLPKLGKIQDRNGEQFVWLRVKLPQGTTNDATLYIEEVQQDYEVYINNQMVHKSGDMSGKSNFSIDGLNLIPLGMHYGGEIIYFRIHSNYHEIGIYGSAIIDTKSNIHLSIIRRDTAKIVFALCYILLGALFIFLFLKDRSQLAYINFALFLISIGIWFISRTEMKNLYLDNMELWIRIRIYSIYFTPYAFLLFYEQLLGKVYKNVSRLFWQIHLIYWICTIILVELRLIPIMNTLILFDSILLISIIYTITFGYTRARRGNREAKIFTLGVISFALAAAFDILVTLGFIPRYPLITQWGLFVFVISMVYILGKQFLKHGILGATLNFKKEQIEQTLRAMTTGTAIINHTIKNEIVKINYLARRAIDFISTHNDQQATRSIHSIFLAVQYMQDMVDKIKDRTAEIQLQEDSCDLQGLLEQTIVLIKPLLDEKRITLSTDYKCNVQLKCDPIYMQDCLVNICFNAIEAMNMNEGIIQIKCYQSKKMIIIEIEDNGCGISDENSLRVFEPFFSTKSNKGNHGLGLSYCYNVMQKHGGTLEITSRINQGTTVYLNFPIKKAVII